MSIASPPLHHLPPACMPTWPRCVSSTGFRSAAKSSVPLPRNDTSRCMLPAPASSLSPSASPGDLEGEPAGACRECGHARQVAPYSRLPGIAAHFKMLDPSSHTCCHTLDHRCTRRPQYITTFASGILGALVGFGAPPAALRSLASQSTLTWNV